MYLSMLEAHIFLKNINRAEENYIKKKYVFSHTMRHNNFTGRNSKKWKIHT
jgi:hypothetical protein